MNNDIYTASDLEYRELKRPQMIVDNLLPVGLTILAGSPKLGKSWLVLGLACSVADGTAFLHHATNQGNVLLLDLEGSPFRIKERLEQACLGFPDYLQIAHDTPKLDAGFMEFLEDWWSCTACPRLIIVDTIVKVRGNRKQSSKNAYEADSEMYSPLQRFALEKGISIVAVTHLRKSNHYNGTGEDWIERVTGSMGLTGVSDNVWGLFRQRGSNSAFLRTTSRDVDAGDFVISFNDGCWRFVSDDINTYEFEGRPLVQFLKTLDVWNGVASYLCDKYKEFCFEHSLPHGLSETQPIVSFGKQMRKVQSEAWRIRKSIHIEKGRDGQHYSISNF